MPNDYRKQGASGGRVGYGEDVSDKLKRASSGGLKPERGSFDLNKEAGVAPGKKLPAAAATRQVPIPKPQDTGKPMQPPPSNVAPHGKNIKPSIYKLEKPES